MATKVIGNGLDTLGGSTPTAGANRLIEQGLPFVATVTVEGVYDLLFHAWNCEAVEAKGNAGKGTKAKKTDDVESYVYRDGAGLICLPGEYLRGAVINAAKYQQDPRSPRKSAMDLYKAAVSSLTPLAPVVPAGGGTAAKWDYLHKCRVTVQRNGVTRTRPAFLTGWKATVRLMVNLPEYVSPQTLNSTLSAAGRLIGVGDFRPTYGRYVVTGFEVGLA